jgi:hypothetical protein
MPHIEAAAPAPPTPSRPTTVGEVVELLDRYAAADRDLDAELERIRTEVSSSRRVSQSTVTRLVTLLEGSLVPGVRAKADLDALPAALRRAGIAQWARRTASPPPGPARRRPLRPLGSIA